MDQAPWQEIDVHEGIENTLIILGHKLRNARDVRHEATVKSINACFLNFATLSFRK